MRRIFIAINLPKNVKEVLAQILAELKKRYRGTPIRFVKANGFHITLHFLGNQNDGMIAKVSRILDEVTARYQRTKLMLGGFGYFPNAVQPRVLWIGVDGVGQKILENLQKDLGKELQKLGIKVDHCDWHPHLTLGRLSGKINTSMLHSMEAPQVEWQVGAVVLMASNLKPTGAEYEILHSVKLSH